MSQPSILTAGKIQVAFERQRDRFTHRIGLSLPNGPQWVLRSIEGSPSDLWPESPPLQELHLEERPGGIQVALLVGMAGRNHWSASCQVDPSAREVQFDIACRTKIIPERLSSLYEVAAGVSLSRDEGQGLLQVSGQTLRLSGLDDTKLEFPGKSQAEFQAPSPESVPQTVQWRYRFWTGT